MPCLVGILLTVGVCSVLVLAQNQEGLFFLPINNITEPSPCTDGACERGTVETGHNAYSRLSEDVVGVERCYSFCFSNVSTF